MSYQRIITGQLIYYIVYKISILRICFQKYFKQFLPYKKMKKAHTNLIPTFTKVLTK